MRFWMPQKLLVISGLIINKHPNFSPITPGKAQLLNEQNEIKLNSEWAANQLAILCICGYLSEGLCQKLESY